LHQEKQREVQDQWELQAMMESQESVRAQTN
jgi:hypothetical protein